MADIIRYDLGPRKSGTSTGTTYAEPFASSEYVAERDGYFVSIPSDSSGPLEFNDNNTDTTAWAILYPGQDRVLAWGPRRVFLRGSGSYKIQQVKL